MPDNLFVLKPANDAFEWGVANKARVAVKVDYPQTGGIMVYYMGHRYPEKVFPFPEAFYAIDGVKRGIMNLLRFLKKSFFAKVYFLWICLMPGNKMFYQCLDLFFNFGNHTLSKIRLKDSYYCPAAREIIRAGRATALELDPKEKYKEFAACVLATIVTIFEYDNAYRYRAQDLIATIDQQEFAKKPFRATHKLLQTMLLRDIDPDVHQKLLPAKVGATLLLLNGSFRRVLKTFIKNLDIQKVYLDVGDYYWAYHFASYNFGGRSFEDRVEERRKAGWPLSL